MFPYQCPRPISRTHTHSFNVTLARTLAPLANYFPLPQSQAPAYRKENRMLLDFSNTYYLFEQKTGLRDRRKIRKAWWSEAWTSRGMDEAGGRAWTNRRETLEQPSLQSLDWHWNHQEHPVRRHQGMRLGVTPRKSISPPRVVPRPTPCKLGWSIR